MASAGAAHFLWDSVSFHNLFPFSAPADWWGLVKVFDGIALYLGYRVYII